MQPRNASRPERRRRASGAARTLLWLVLPLVIVCALPGAACAQRFRFELRAGIVGSTELAEDQVANPGLARQLGTKFDGSVRAKPGIGFVLAAAAETALRARTVLDLSLAWSRAGLHAEDGAGQRRIQTLNSGQATLGVRYRLTPLIDAGCGFGALRYFASGGLFGSGGELSPMVECGGGVHFGPDSRVVLRGVGAVHRFRTPVLRDASGQTGSVFRFSLQAGVVVGGNR